LVEQVGYCVADVGDWSVGAWCWDLIGLAGGLGVVVGSVVAMRTRARSPESNISPGATR
jgi:hypothetical protein